MIQYPFLIPKMKLCNRVPRFGKCEKLACFRTSGIISLVLSSVAGWEWAGGGRLIVRELLALAEFFYQLAMP